MTLPEKYTDSDGRKCDLATLCSRESGWAANRILSLERERDEARDCGQDAWCAIAPGCQRHWDERNQELVQERDEARQRLAEMTAHRDACEATLGRIAQWTYEYGAALCPPGADTYGEGMRQAKKQVQVLLVQARKWQHRS